jgi:hypothetical protein
MQYITLVYLFPYAGQKDSCFTSTTLYPNLLRNWESTSREKSVNCGFLALKRGKSFVIHIDMEGEKQGDAKKPMKTKKHERKY